MSISKTLVSEYYDKALYGDVGPLLSGFDQIPSKALNELYKDLDKIEEPSQLTCIILELLCMRLYGFERGEE